MEPRLQIIDPLAIPDHHFLINISEEECFFILSYTAHKSYDFNCVNSLIINLKKKYDRKGQPDWHYKEIAIQKCAYFLECVNIIDVFGNDTTYIPIPPSKSKNDPLYDNRLTQILKKAYNGKLNVAELIAQKKSTQSFHLSNEKRSIDEIQSNYIINQELVPTINNSVIIFDDILTTGAHYIAMKNLISSILPHVSIKGLFIARRVFEVS